ncbi:endonuclease domain-containing protein [Acinetobacter oleivorans]|uniref:endonuclease domain-containing protein n=1 Tax=Acinetobacter oleivorans TaxID=1148157 RepID=UPI0021D2EE88|nr:endonuclease domain-containing protein [Acinetobacter oleivorans]MCU4409655.1 endonuclease domain-containing protein [Acinetobacter oleivorans]
MTSISLAEYRELFPVKTKKRRSAKQGTRQPSEGETVLATHLRACKINFEQEYKFHPKRKWRADFLITGTKILVEVEGGIWSGGRHTRGKGYIGDMEKYNSAAMMGFTVLRFSTEQVKSGLAVQQIEKMVGGMNDTNDR